MGRLFNEIREGEGYINISFREEVGFNIIKMLEEEEYYIHYIKEKNEKYKEDEILQNLYKDKKKLQKDISIREQELNK